MGNSEKLGGGISAVFHLTSFSKFVDVWQVVFLDVGLQMGGRGVSPLVDIDVSHVEDTDGSGMLRSIRNMREHHRPNKDRSVA